MLIHMIVVEANTGLDIFAWISSLIINDHSMGLPITLFYNQI